MNPSERGKENLDAIEGRNDERVDRASGTSTSNGEAAGGDRNDVPGGAYNVPPGMAENVSDEDAKRQKNPDR